MKFNIKQSQEAALKEEQKNVNKNKVTVTTVSNEKSASSGTLNEGELEFNKKHRESYETLMKESSTQLDGYWDSKNPFVKLFLLGLGVVAILGVVYYVMTYMATMK